MRIDRAASLYFFRFLPRRSKDGIPILMYHSISKRPARPSAPPRRRLFCLRPYYETRTSPSAFANQMACLHENGYTALSLNKVASLAAGGSPAGVCNASQARGGHSQERKKVVAITFDDGYQDFYTNAFPILSNYGYTATVFLPTMYIGETERAFNGTPCLTWSRVRELDRWGIHFGSHSVTHPKLSEVGPRRLRLELEDSKCAIEDHLGRCVTSFSYPYAFPQAQSAFLGELRSILLDAGYQNGVSTEIGLTDSASDRLFMRRLPVNDFDDPKLFRAKLKGNYDWLRLLQSLRKGFPKISPGSTQNPLSGC